METSINAIAKTASAWYIFAYIDGREDGKINISGVENYEVGSADTDTSDSESEGVATDQDEVRI